MPSTMIMMWCESNLTKGYLSLHPQENMYLPFFQVTFQFEVLPQKVNKKDPSPSYQPNPGT